MSISDYITDKLALLEQCGIYPSKADKVRLSNAKSEIQCDNIARDIICPPLTDMRMILR